MGATNDGKSRQNIALLKALTAAGYFSEIPSDPKNWSEGDSPLVILERRGKLTEAEALKALAERIEMRYVDLTDAAVRKRCRTDLFRLAGEELCRDHHIAPLYEENDGIVAAIANPFAVDAASALRFALSRPVTLVLAEQPMIDQLIKDFAEKGGSAEFLADSGLDFPVEEAAEGASKERPLLRPSAEPAAGSDTRVVKFINQMLTGALTQKATEVHIEPHGPRVVVKYRIAGEKKEIVAIPAELSSAVIERCKMISMMDSTQRGVHQEGKLRIYHGNEVAPFAVAAIPSVRGERLEFRLQRREERLKRMSRLGMSEQQVERLREALRQPGGIVIIVGPADAGVTTTRYACLHELHDGSRHIASLEDPIEYRIDGIRQIEVSFEDAESVAAGMRSALDAKPAVAMIGELRSPETAALAIQAAASGASVLTSMRTADIPSTITELRRFGVEPSALAARLRAIVVQRLVRTNCPNCRSQREVSEHEKNILHSAGCDALELVSFSEGCEYCDGTGWAGRTGVFSILEASPSTAARLVSGEWKGAECDEAKEHGYREIRQEAYRLLADGTISFEHFQPLLPGVRKQDKVIAIKDRLSPERRYDGPQGAGADRARRDSEEKTVLIIEDDLTIRSMVSWILKKEGFKTVAADNGETGLKALVESQPDLIICDSLMPELDGRGFMKRLKQLPTYSALPVIILTGEESSQAELEYLELGAHDFIRKSSPAEVFVARARNALEQGPHDSGASGRRNKLTPAAIAHPAVLI